MVEKIEIMGEVHIISKEPQELFPRNPREVIVLKSAMDMMNDCLDYIYDLMKPSNPQIFRPQLYLSASHEINAVSIQKDIIVYTGLIENVISLIEKKYPDHVLEKYSILKSLDKDEIRSGLRVYTWRFVVLHELFHIWHAHITWLSNYRFSESGKIETRISADKKRFSEVAVLEEAAMIYSIITSGEKRQALITQQAIELDADSCALSMIINMIIKDAHVRYERGIIKDTEEYITSEVGLIMGALATAFSLFDGCAGAKFDLLKKDLDNMNHPIPAIRMYVAEEVTDGMLWKYYEDPQKHFEIEREWQHIVCDVEPYYNGQVDMGRVFYYTAYTEKAQKHLTN